MHTDLPSLPCAVVMLLQLRTGQVFPDALPGSRVQAEEVPPHHLPRGSIAHGMVVGHCQHVQPRIMHIPDQHPTHQGPCGKVVGFILDLLQQLTHLIIGASLGHPQLPWRGLRGHNLERPGPLFKTEAGAKTGVAVTDCSEGVTDASHGDGARQPDDVHHVHDTAVGSLADQKLLEQVQRQLLCLGALPEPSQVRRRGRRISGWLARGVLRLSRPRER